MGLPMKVWCMAHGIDRYERKKKSWNDCEEELWTIICTEREKMAARVND